MFFPIQILIFIIYNLTGINKKKISQCNLKLNKEINLHWEFSELFLLIATLSKVVI